MIKNGNYFDSTCDVDSSIIAVAAMRGSVPLHAVVTRGVDPLSPIYNLLDVALTVADPEEEEDGGYISRYAAVSKFSEVSDSTTTTSNFVRPSIALQAAAERSRGQLMTGVRSKPAPESAGTNASLNNASDSVGDINDEPFTMKSTDSLCMTSNDQLLIILDTEEVNLTFQSYPTLVSS